ncbi:hypothetical protein ACT3RN_10640 [Psychrobacter sp. AOP5-GZ1-6]|uniref:hypothetical protein n=2 Tax=Psychrobacter TaxID=497 RepID=UPI001787D40C|nr:hypothetical protein [Psychrobacter sp. FME13]MBE0442347.1 hypothetical protein [Psychrobacter sp. FME13]
MGIKHKLVIAISDAVFGRIASATAINALGFDTIYGVCMALVNEPSWTGGVDAVVLSIDIALSVMGAADDDRMG